MPRRTALPLPAVASIGILALAACAWVVWLLFRTDSADSHGPVDSKTEFDPAPTATGLAQGSVNGILALSAGRGAPWTSGMTRAGADKFLASYQTSVAEAESKGFPLGTFPYPGPPGPWTV